MGSKRLALLPLLPTWIFIPLFWIVNEFAPMAVKFELIAPLMESMAVRIPTNAMIPIAMIKAVSVARSFWLLMLCIATFKFSLNSMKGER